MPLSNVQLNQTFSWTLATTIAAGLPAVQQQGNGLLVNLNGISTSTWNQLYSEQFTLAASGGTTTINLASFTNNIGEATGFGHVHSISVTVDGTAANVQLGPASSDGLTWFFGGTSPVINIVGTDGSDGATFTYQNAAGGAGTAVDSTHKQLTLTNTGTGTATVTVICLGSTT